MIPLARKTLHIMVHALPVAFMIALIPFFTDDYLLTFIFCGIIAISFFLHREPKDLAVFVLGLVIMFFAELLFIHTGVEVFARKSLAGAMPLWLPFLWGYGFVAIKRSVAIL